MAGNPSYIQPRLALLFFWFPTTFRDSGNSLFLRAGDKPNDNDKASMPDSQSPIQKEDRQSREKGYRYQRHPWKAMPYKSKEDARRAKRRWRANNKEKERMYGKTYRAKHANQRRLQGQKRRAEIRKRRIDVFGEVCALCGEKNFIGAPKLGYILHEIHGKPHYNENHRSKEAMLRDSLKHPEDFAPLCIADHKMVHRLMKVFGLSWEDILNLLKGRLENPNAAFWIVKRLELSRQLSSKAE